METQRWSALLAHWSGGRGPRYVQLSQALQGCIECGQVGSAEQLPSERHLADLLNLSRSTVVAAYEHLASEGWVSRRQGSGTHVSPTAPRQAEVLALRSPLRTGHQPPGELDLTIAVPTLTPVQQARVQQASAGAFSESVYHPLGLADLRATLAQLYSRSGLPTTPEQIIVTTGAQQAISIIASTFLKRGDCALLETPTYFGAIDVFRAAGARLLGSPVTAQGVRPTDFEQQLAAGPRLAFLTPTFQNPTGTVLPAGSRERVAGLIAHAQLPTIEDETLIDLGLSATKLPPRLAAFAPTAPIICVGSLSKLFWAGLRVGWMRVPASLAAPLIQSKTLCDFGSSMPSQMIALNLLQDLPTLRAERRAAVLPARDLLVNLLREKLPDWSFEVPSGGQFLWAQLPTRNASGFTHAARRHGVRLFPGASMGVTDLPDSYLRLPFTVPPEYLPEAVERLAAAWQSFRERGAGERLA
ncbi:aminotransferase-like domain-containing protein [Deinococcus ruber]|uniref:DNA-binding transcriptional regulator n=1 Tax=Deinococcus ruber TaxID=1848197 RepID=A0A918C6F5_9DEIO|nr:PLP-dependent aminotransferase family protein [Deinococcus ruber]GGR07993.1 DNA-binding transcriptional regulator [Deinococcus ruber]